MEATTPRVASRTWRSILVGMDALKIGLVKRVGSSESIFIWDDSWIPGTTTIRTMGRQHATDLLMVNELITSQHQWNVSLIRNMFFALDANAILKILLRMSAGEDFMAWARETSGI
jgi:hypothetical protein